jgi:xanthine/CO dehydrogenase XdhC/CoxF family maturation factor
MNDSTSFTGHFAFIFSQRASRVLFLAVSGVFTMLAILLTGNAGLAQTAAERIAVGPIASVPSPGQVQDMKLLAPGVGWALQQNHLYWTEDNGQDWADITPPNAHDISGVFFLNREYGWTVFTQQNDGNGGQAAIAVASTSNGGQSWEVSQIGSEALPRIEGIAGVSSIFFSDPEHGWLMFRLVSSSNFSFGILLKTADGGINWTRLPTPPAAGTLGFSSDQTGWMAGGPAGDKLWSTNDGGTTWTLTNLPKPNAEAQCGIKYSLPHFTGGGSGVLATTIVCPDHSDLVDYASGNRGLSWHILAQQTITTGGGISDIFDDHVVHILTKSSTGLTTQTTSGLASATVPELSRSVGTVTHASFVDDQNGWLLYSTTTCVRPRTGCSTRSGILSTADGGQTYLAITPTITNSGHPQAAPLSNESSNALKVVPLLVGTNSSIVSGEGFDMCAVPTATQMQNQWSLSGNPYTATAIYVGGETMSCSQPNLTASWVTQVSSQGWDLIPLWVGPQAVQGCSICQESGGTPCPGMSTNTATAGSQGAAEADSAVNAANALGVTHSIIYYDLEAYGRNCGTASCISQCTGTLLSEASASAKAFVNGWVQELHAKGFDGGVYGSSLNAEDDWNSTVIAYPADAVWLGAWNGYDDVQTPAAVFNLWPSNMRIHQYCNSGTTGTGSCAGQNTPSSALLAGNWFDDDAINGPIFASSSSSSDLPPPTLTYPSNGATGIATTPTFSWSSVPGADSGYRILVAPTEAALPTDPTASTCTACVVNYPPSGTQLLTPSYTPPQGTLSAGTQYFWEVHGRSVNYYGTWSDIYSFTTTATAKTTPAVTVSANPSSITTAQSTVVTVTVSPTSGNPTPTGSVTLTGGSFNSGSVALNNGSASITVPGSSLPANSSVQLTATYSGDSNYNTNTGTGSVNVSSPAKTTPAVTVSANPSSITTAQSTVVTVTVSPTSGNPTPTGSVTLTGGSFNSGSVALNSNGSASITVPGSSLPANSSVQLTAAYSGDSHYNTNTGTGSVAVTSSAKATPTVTVTPSSSSITTTQSLTVTVAVSGSPTPTGTVTLTGGGYSNTQTLSSGSTTFGITAGSLSTGSDTLTATYQGDSNYNAAVATTSVTVAATQVSCNSYSATSQITGVAHLFQLGLGNGKLVASGNGQASIIDLVSNQVSPVPFSSAYSGGYGAKVSVLNSQAFVPIYNLSQGEVAVLDLGSATISGYFHVGTEPFASLVVGNQLYIGDASQFSNGDPSQVFVVNPVSGQISASINAGHLIQALVSDPAHNRLYALNYSDSTASAIDLTSNAVTSTISLGVMPRAGIVVNGTLFVVGDLPTTQTGQIVEVNTTSNTVGATVSVGRDPMGIVAANGCAFVPNSSDYTVSVLDLTANAIVKTISSGIGNDPTGAVADPSTGYVYIANQTSNSISILTPSSTTTPIVNVMPTPSSITTAQAMTVTVTMSVPSGDPTPTGTVCLTATNVSGCSVLTNGSATFNIPAGTLPVGSNQTLSVIYTPDASSSSTYNSAAGSNPVTVTTAKTTPTVTVVPTPASITTAQQLSVAVTVNATSGNPTPTGSVVLVAGTGSFNGTLVSGTAIILVPAGTFAPGTDQLTATYSPDSTSSSVYNSTTVYGNVVVTTPAKITPIVNVVPTPSSITTAQAMTVTVTMSVPSGDPTPTGTVCLTATNVSGCSVLTNGSATFNIPAGTLPVGSNQTLSVTYTPDSSSSSIYNSATGSNPVTVNPVTKTTPTVTVVPIPSSITTAQQLSVAVTVNATSGNPTPTGSVVLVAGTGSFNGTLVSGIATITVPAGAFAAGTDQLTATYTPDSTSSSVYNSATGTGSVIVTAPAKTTPSVTVVPTPSSITTAQQLSVAVTVHATSGNPTPTGSVVLVAGTGSFNGTLVSGVVTITVPVGAFAAGTDQLTATFTPDSTSSSVYNGATGTGSVIVTAPAKTTPTVTVVPTPSSITTAQQLSAAVTVNATSGNPTPTGSVVLVAGTGSFNGTLVSGVATITVPAGAFAAGTDQLTATYTPDSTSSSVYNSATGTGSVIVTAPAKTTPTVTVTPSASSITITQPLTVTVSVNGGNGNAMPTGSVKLTGGGYTSAAITLSSGSATINIPANSLSAGTDTLSVSYTPDSSSSSTYNSASGSVTVTVTSPAKTTPTVSVTPSASSITTAQALTVTVAVNGGTGNPTPTGSVTLTGGGYTSAAITLSSGSATINIPANSLSAGTDTLSVSYTPDSSSSSTYNSASGSVTVTVTTPAKATPKVTVTPSASSITTAQPLTVTVTVNGGTGNPTPTGTVTLSSGSYSAQQTLASGTASFNIAAGTLGNGANTLTASYSGDATYSVASSTTTVTVEPVSISTTTPSAVNPGSSTTSTLTLTGSGGYSGTMNLTCTLTSSPAGAQSLPTCALNPASVTLASGGNGTSTLTVKTTAASTTALARPTEQHFWKLGSGGAALAALLLFGIPFRRRRWTSMLALLLFVAAAGAIGCVSSKGTSGGSGGGSSTPATTSGNYSFTVAATDSVNAKITASTTVTLTVQ